MMTKTLVSSALIAVLAFSVGACAQQAPRNSEPPSYDYKPHLSVLAKDLPPSEIPVDMFALQGTWKGNATLVADHTVSGGTPCSERIATSWTVVGTRVTGESVTPRGSSITHKGSIDSRGRFSVTATDAGGYKHPVRGWFGGERAIGFLRATFAEGYCDFRIDLSRRD